MKRANMRPEKTPQVGSEPAGAAESEAPLEPGAPTFPGTSAGSAAPKALPRTPRSKRPRHTVAATAVHTKNATAGIAGSAAMRALQNAASTMEQHTLTMDSCTPSWATPVPQHTNIHVAPKPARAAMARAGPSGSMTAPSSPPATAMPRPARASSAATTRGPGTRLRVNSVAASRPTAEAR